MKCIHCGKSVESKYMLVVLFEVKYLISVQFADKMRRFLYGGDKNGYICKNCKQLLKEGKPTPKAINDAKAKSNKTEGIGFIRWVLKIWQETAKDLVGIVGIFIKIIVELTKRIIKFLRWLW